MENKSQTRDELLPCCHLPHSTGKDRYLPHQGLIFALLINLYNRTRWLQWPFCLCLTAFSFKTQNFWAKLLQNIVHQNTDLGNNWETNTLAVCPLPPLIQKTAFWELIQNTFPIAFEATLMKPCSVADYISFTKFWVSVSHLPPRFPQ